MFYCPPFYTLTIYRLREHNDWLHSYSLYNAWPFFSPPLPNGQPCSYWNAALHKKAPQIFRPSQTLKRRPKAHIANRKGHRQLPPNRDALLPALTLSILPPKAKPAIDTCFRRESEVFQASGGQRPRETDALN